MTDYPDDESRKRAESYRDEEARQQAKQEATDEAERIMARKRAIRDGGGTNRAARRKANAMARPRAPKW